MRTVLDPNVIISALLSPSGAPARILRAWLNGRFELIVSPRLLDELQRALGYPKLRTRIEADESQRVIELLAVSAVLASDPEQPPTTRSPDPEDDYLLALAEAERAALISGDEHLLGLGGGLPIYRPARFLRMLETERSREEP